MDEKSSEESEKKEDNGKIVDEDAELILEDQTGEDEDVGVSTSIELEEVDMVGEESERSTVEEGTVEEKKEEKPSEEEAVMDRETLLMLQDLHAEADKLLDPSCPSHVYHLSDELRLAVSKYSKALFEWFICLDDPSLLISIDRIVYINDKFPVPPQKVQPGFFRKDICPRLVDFWRQSKCSRRMAVHFKLDEPTVIMALLYHSLCNASIEVDVIPLLRQFELDHNMYHMVASFILLHSNDKKWPSPCDVVCHAILQPLSLSLLLYITYCESTRGQSNRIQWENVKIEVTQVSMKELMEFDQMITTAIDELAKEEKEEEEKRVEEMKSLEKTLEMMMKETQSYVAQMRKMNDICNIRERHNPLLDRRKEAIEDILPENFEEGNNKLKTVEKEIEMVDNDIQECFYGKERLTRDDVMDLKEGTSVYARRDADARKSFEKATFLRYEEDNKAEVVMSDGQQISLPRCCVCHPTLKLPLMAEGIRVCALTVNLNIPPSSPRLFSGTIASKIDLSRGEYLVFFDDSFESYARKVFVLLDQSFDAEGNFRKELTHNYIQPAIGARADEHIERIKFISLYFRRYPDWQLVRMKKGKGQRVSVHNRNGRIWSAIVMDVDRAMCTLRFNSLGGDQSVVNCIEEHCSKHVHIHDKLYRGSLRLSQLKQAYSYTSYSTNTNNKGITSVDIRAASRLTRRHRRANQLGAAFESAVPDSIALNSTGEMALPKNTMRKKSMGTTRDNAVPAITHTHAKSKKGFVSQMKMEYHQVHTITYAFSMHHYPCSHDCLKGQDCDPSNSRFSSTSPFFIPITCGWRRQVDTHSCGASKKDKREVYYRAPCGRSLFDEESIAEYLEVTCSELTIDLFSFDSLIDETRYASLDKKYKQADDFTNGMEGRPLPVVNEVDKEKPPSFAYRARRYPVCDKVDLTTINKSMCSGCSCTDNCRNSDKCECQRLSVNEYKRLAKALRDGKGRYRYRRLDAKVISGIYECNDNCPCNRKRCFNRVVQNDIILPLQMMKTPEMGWGVRTLCDLPKGTFICNYNGALLTDEMGENWEEGDEYFADLDLLDVVEQNKANAGVDLLVDNGVGDLDSDEDDNDKDKQTKRNPSNDDEDFIEDMGSGDEDTGKVSKKSIDNGRNSGEEEKKEEEEVNEEGGNDEDTVEGTHFHDRYFSKAGKSPLYVLDAKSSGNVGRFLNHSCEPNVMVQHVLVDTHDLRLPWVAFFTSRLVKAGEELFWDYGWHPTEGMQRGLKCCCGAQTCRGDLL